MRAADPNSAALAVRASLVGVVNGPVHSVFGVIRRQHDGFPSRALACPGLEYKLGLEQMLLRISNAGSLQHVPICSWVLFLVRVALDILAGWKIRSVLKCTTIRTLTINSAPTTCRYVLAQSG